ncbi:MAG TPA: NUDIX hydrolase [Candidatus Saccharimonadales bacterium]
MKNPWKTLSSKIVYQNPWMRVHEDAVITPTGKEGIYGFFESKDSVIVGALNEKNEIYLIYAYSYPAKCWRWQLPGGGGENEDIIEASKRELAEETGIAANSWEKLQSTRVCDGFMTERTTTLLARELTLGERAQAEDNGLIAKGDFFSLDSVRDMVEAGDIDDGQSVTALYLIEKWLAKHRNM